MLELKIDSMVTFNVIDPIEILKKSKNKLVERRGVVRRKIDTDCYDVFVKEYKFKGHFLVDESNFIKIIEIS